MSNNPQYLTDGDNGWVGVDTFSPPHTLRPGIAADAVNKRFENGQAWPRFSAALQPWGTVDAVQGALFSGNPPLTPYQMAVATHPLQVGRKYIYVPGDEDQATDARTNHPSPPAYFSPSGNVLTAGEFTATTTAVYFWKGPPGAGESFGAMCT